MVLEIVHYSNKEGLLFKVLRRDVVLQHSMSSVLYRRILCLMWGISLFSMLADDPELAVLQVESNLPFRPYYHLTVSRIWHCRCRLPVKAGMHSRFLSATDTKV